MCVHTYMCRASKALRQQSPDLPRKLGPRPVLVTFERPDAVEDFSRRWDCLRSACGFLDEGVGVVGVLCWVLGDWGSVGLGFAGLTI